MRPGMSELTARIEGLDVDGSNPVADGEGEGAMLLSPSRMPGSTTPPSQQRKAAQGKD